MERTLFGVTRNGENVERVSFRNGRFHFSVLTFGAVLYSFGFDDVNLVLNHGKLSEYEGDSTYMGEVVGPYANRIADAAFTLDGMTYQLEKNDNGNNLHSGSACFGQRVWSIIGIGESSITLSLSTPAGLGGFPGFHECTVTYLLSSDGTLVLDYIVSSDRKCPVSVTNHTYFNLNGGGRDIKNHVLAVPAESYVSVDERLIPTGIVPVESTDFDFRTPHAIGERRNGAYDNTFCIERDRRIHVSGDKADMEVWTSEPGVQIYTGEFLSGDHGPFDGVCFESGRYPDTPNNPDFPQAFTEQGKPYRTTTEFRIEVK